MVKKQSPSEHFVFRNTHPDNLAERALGATAVNAAAIASGEPWDVFFRSLLKQSQDLSLMPNNYCCVKEMLRSHGFILQPSCQSKLVTAEEICTYMNEHCTSGVRALIKTPMYGYGGHLLAIVPVTENGRTSYKIAGYEDRSRSNVEEIWLRWPDGEDHSPVDRRKPTRTGTGREHRIPESHGNYCYHQENPENRRIGDCLIRGLASACGVSWKEVIEMFVPYRQTTVNNNTLFRDVLKKQGFVYCDLYRPGQKFPTVSEFCTAANRKFRRGEHLFVCVGSSHVAAVLPFPNDVGGYRYRVVDTWDSSSRKATEYWFRPAAEEPEEAPVAPAFAVGDRIEHPAFGTGIVCAVTGDVPQLRLEIEFPDGGIRKFAAGWVEEHCRKCGE